MRTLLVILGFVLGLDLGLVLGIILWVVLGIFVGINLTHRQRPALVPVLSSKIPAPRTTLSTTQSTA